MTRGHAFGRGVGAMRRAKGVVDIKIGQLRQLLGEDGIVGLLLVVIADIFQQQNIARLQQRRRSFRPFRRRNRPQKRRPAEHVRELVGHRAKRHRRFALALGAAEVGHQDDFGALIR